MAYGRRDPSIFDAFTLSPLPYPVILILLLVLLLLGFSWSFAYEDLLESAEEQLSWLLLATPLALLLLIRWIDTSSLDLPAFFGFGPRRRAPAYYVNPSDAQGASPWGVAAVLLLLILLLSFQSTFQDMWGA